MSSNIDIHIVCATRPNFMKIAPLYHALKKEAWCSPKIVHTGQHYDYQMSQVFFEELGLPFPDFYLKVGSGSHAEQTGNVMMAYEELCLSHKPDLVIVVGDVNSTMACAITAKKLLLQVAHLEAGLRSFDRLMPEEINRIVTDSISDILWTPSVDADENLRKEGVSKEKIHKVGNIMIDSYKTLEGKINANDTRMKLKLEPKEYAIMTLHRPVNVDNFDGLSKIMQKISKIELPIIFPVHPRTRKGLESMGLWEKIRNIRMIDPLGYIEFMNLVKSAKFVITDSGGIQEETTYLNIPCFTLRESTERPVTVTLGSNQLVNLENLLEKIKIKKEGKIPELWDGQTANRIVEYLKQRLQ